MEETIIDQTVGEIVRKSPATARLFRKLNIDFCCGGNVTLKSVCDRKGLDYARVIEGIADLNIKKGATHELNFDEMTLSFLAEYIYQIHHKYLYRNLPEVGFFVNKLYEKHKEKYPWLYELHKLYTELEKDLLGHMSNEEDILFPYIKDLEEKKKTNEVFKKSIFGSFENPLVIMKSEHDHVGEIIHRLGEITNDYSAPGDACNSHLVMLQKLKELVEDLIQHIHLENNILFPKIVDLEQKYFS